MATIKPSSETNNEIHPIIGILCYDIDFAIRDAYEFGNDYPFYISAAFVKWIESAGGQVIPIWTDRDEDYYRNIMSQINGILLPGGKFWFNDDIYGKAAYSARKIYDIAVEMNDKGNYFPIWGTTIGFQLLFYAASGGQTDSRQQMSLYNGNFPFHFENNINESKLFGNMEPYYHNLLSTEPVAYYYSIFCVTKEILENYQLINDWLILSKATNNENVEFITSVEHKKYPFFGVMCPIQISQFGNSRLANNSRDACIASQYFANFFINQCKQNTNRMSNDERLRKSICNFGITYVEPKVSNLRQVYLFKKTADYPKTPNSNIPV